MAGPLHLDASQHQPAEPIGRTTYWSRRGAEAQRNDPFNGDFSALPCLRLTECFFLVSAAPRDRRLRQAVSGETVPPLTGISRSFPGDHPRSKRSAFITLVQAATKSRASSCCKSS